MKKKSFLICSLIVVLLCVETVWKCNAEEEIWGQLEILSPSVLAQTNAYTGELWKRGDTYRLAFVTTPTTDATSTNIATYNAFVQSVAEGSSTFTNLGDVAWLAIASTASIDARDNTQTVPGTSPDGPIFLLNGTTQIAANNADLWDGTAANRLQKTEENVDRAKDTPYYTSWTAVWSGTSGSGIKSNPLGVASARFGLLYDADSMWISRATGGNAGLLPIYAISEPLTIQAHPAGTVIVVR